MSQYETLLHEACWLDDEWKIKKLLENKGADLDLENSEGTTARELAELRCGPDVLAYIDAHYPGNINAICMCTAENPCSYLCPKRFT